VKLENKAHKRKQAAMWTQGTLKKKEVVLNMNRRDTKYLLEKALEWGNY
jgi:RecA-family ATPase